MELTLNKLKESELKCNIEKSFCGKTENEYLGFWVIRNGVKPIDKNRSNKEYDDTYFLKRSTSVYRFSKLLSIYVGKIITYVSTFN